MKYRLSPIISSKWFRVVALLLFVGLFSFVLVQSIQAQTTETVLKIGPGDQPEPTLAPRGARSIIFTRVKLKAVGKDIKINSMTIERTGSGQDGAFSSVGIEDIGDSGDLNAVHQYTVRAPITIQAGEEIEIEIKGNIKSNPDAYQLQQPTLSLVAIETDARIEGKLPITGTAHTINSKLIIGTLKLAKGLYDPLTSNVTVNEKSVILNGMKVTLGSAEPVKLKNVYWIPTGSADDSDLINPTAVVDYKGQILEVPANVYYDGDGTKKYRAKIDKKITIAAGDIVEIYIKADIGKNPDRTIKMSPDKINGIGAVFGYEVRDTTTRAPATLTIVSASLTVDRSTADTFQGEPLLGVITLTTEGEVMNVKNIEITTGEKNMLSLNLYNEQGEKISGPVNGVGNTVNFTKNGVWQIPTGATRYIVTGQTKSFYNVTRVDAVGDTTKVKIPVTIK